MTMLNKEIRDQILNNALNAAGVYEAADHIEKLYADLAETLRLIAINAKNDDHLNKMLDDAKIALSHLNDNFFVGAKSVMPTTRDHIVALIDGESVAFYFSGRQLDKSVTKQFVSKEPVRLFKSNKVHCRFIEDYRKLLSFEKDADQLSADVYTQVSTMIYSVNSVRTLLEIWPESRQLLPDWVIKTIPAEEADLEMLNSVMGLTSKGDQNG